MSQGSLWHPVEEAGFDHRAGCPSSRPRSSPLKAQAIEDGEASNSRFIKACRGPTGAAEAGDRSDTSHARPPPTAPRKPPLHKRIRGEPGAYTPNMLVQGTGALYKVACAQAEEQRKAGPTPRPWRSWQLGNRTTLCNQAPSYIRGPRPLE
jgi:hypothetical protein